MKIRSTTPSLTPEARSFLEMLEFRVNRSDRDALRLGEARRELRARDVEELRRRWDAGKASGLAGEINMRELIDDEK